MNLPLSIVFWVPWFLILPVLWPFQIGILAALMAVTGTGHPFSPPGILPPASLGAPKITMLAIPILLACAGIAAELLFGRSASALIPPFAGIVCGVLSLPVIAGFEIRCQGTLRSAWNNIGWWKMVMSRKGLPEWMSASTALMTLLHRPFLLLQPRKWASASEQLTRQLAMRGHPEEPGPGFGPPADPCPFVFRLGGILCLMILPAISAVLRWCLP